MITVLELKPLKKIANWVITVHRIGIFSHLNEAEFRYYAVLEDADMASGSVRAIPWVSGKFRFVFRIFSAMRRLKPDFILGTASIHEVFLALLKPTNTRYAVMWHGPLDKDWLLDIGDRTWRARLMYHVSKYLIKRSDLVFCDSEFIRRSIVDKFPGKKVVVMHNAVDGTVFTPAKRDKNALHEIFHIDRSKKAALFICHLIRRKRPDFYWRLAKENPEIEFILVGREGNFTRRDVEQWRVEAPNFHWFNFVQSAVYPILFASVDFFVFPPLQEPFGVSVIEAMASGVPVVAVRSGALPEIIRDGEGGFLIDHDEKEICNFSEKLKFLSSEESERQRMGASARKRAQELFQWELVAERVSKGFRSVIGEK
jgi:glycosyltransferase involved in cell wall biosynthesis